jgi:hypothetical protein
MFSFYPLPISSSILPPLFHISFIHPISLPSHVLNCLSLLIAHSAPCFLSFRLIPVFSLLVPTTKSRHHFSLFCTLSLQALRNFLCHTPLILLVVSGFFDSFPSFLLFYVFIPFTQLYLYPSSFCSQSFHFFTGIPVPLVVFLPLLLLRVFSLLSSIPLTLFPHYIT